MNALAHIADPYWLAASEHAMAAATHADCVLVPQEFLGLHPRFAPLEFSWTQRDMQRLAWCCSKDDVDKLAPWVHKAARDSKCCGWSNEVFVLGGNFAWPHPPDASSRLHLQAWFERLGRYHDGTPIRPLQTRAIPGFFTKDVHRPRVLLVGASYMGNVGDDLIAQVLGEMLTADGAQVHLSGPNIDPLHVAKYDAVIVGGGGIVYASRDGSNEAQNIANYLKFGPMAAHFGIPSGLIGVGDQDHAGMLELDPLINGFARQALKHFQHITTRDAATTQLLHRLGASHALTGSDPVFSLLEQARGAVKPTASQPARIALVGELYRFRSIAMALGDGEGSLAPAIRDGEFDILIMSDDDVAHAERMRQALQRVGAGASVIDLRNRDLQSLVFLFASYRSIVTTRFHALIIAALSEVPAVTLDVPQGKKARLLRELNANWALVTDSDIEHATAQLAQALRGDLAKLPSEAIQRIATQTSVHRNALCDVASLKRPLESNKQRQRAVAPIPSDRAVDAVSAIADQDGAINLCWAAASPSTNGYANLGDSLSAVMVAALSGRTVRHANFDEARAKLVAVGSIGHAIRRGTAVIWGAGVSIRGGVLAQNVRQTNYDVRAMRGPISAQHYRDFGLKVPDVFGDPVWLLPSIVSEPVEQIYELGIIPHINDVERAHPHAAPKLDSLRYYVPEADSKRVVVINTWHEPTWEGVLAKIRLIRSCKRIVSQSFHGVVIAEAYRIPALNFRTMPGRQNGLLKIDLGEPCSTDPRIWEFFKGGRRPHFHMYTQRRDEPSDWESIMRSVDSAWEPFEYDATDLVSAFPLQLAYDPLTSVAHATSHLSALRF